MRTFWGGGKGITAIVEAGVGRLVGDSGGQDVVSSPATMPGGGLAAALRRGALMLAVGLTTTSICMSVLAGGQRGGSLLERLVWQALGGMMVLCAHLLPALCRTSAQVVRRATVVLWAACTVVVCYGHVTFILSSQQHAGEQRADAIVIPIVAASSQRNSGRGSAPIADDIAETKAELAMNDSRHCRTSCSARAATHDVLIAKLDALQVEADAAKRRLIAEDREVAQADRAKAARDAARDDPVVARVVKWSGATVAQIELTAGLVVAITLEGVACLCWFISLAGPTKVVTTVPLGGPVAATTFIELDGGGTPVLPESQAVVSSREAEQHIGATTKSESEDDMLVAKLGRDVAAGRCAQPKVKYAATLAALKAKRESSGGN